MALPSPQQSKHFVCILSTKSCFRNLDQDVLYKAVASYMKVVWPQSHAGVVSTQQLKLDARKSLLRPFWGQKCLLI